MPPAGRSVAITEGGCVKRLIVALVSAVFVLCCFALNSQHAKTEDTNRPTDMSLELVSMDPPSGSTLKANEPITVRFRYKYSRPKMGLHSWAKILDETYSSTYQGTFDDMTPGTGIVERYVLLTEPGVVKKITLVIKDSAHSQIYSRDFPVDYTYVPNPEAEAMRNDGAGSRIVGVRFSPMSPAKLSIGSTVSVDLDYDINNADGLDMWVEPLTNCNMTYDGMTGPMVGKGTIRKTFAVGEACRIEKVKVAMINAANRTIFEKVVDVDFNFAK